MNWPNKVYNGISVLTLGALTKSISWRGKLRLGSTANIFLTNTTPNNS
jgi:hypothetical protein